MKYAIGDKVRVREDLNLDCYYYMEDHKNRDKAELDMLNYRGKKVTISEIRYGKYLLKEDIFHWYWTDEMFEGLEERMFTKDDLVTGMFGVTRNGNLFVVVNSILIFQKGTYSELSDYREDLTYLGPDKGFDIVKVVSNIKAFYSFEFGDVVFEEPKRMTKKEIEAKLGYKIKIVDEIEDKLR